MHSVFWQVVLDEHKSKVVDFQIIWCSSSDSQKYKPYFSIPQLIEFPTDVDGQKAYAYFYPPCNPDYEASQEESPPLLLESHGMFSLWSYNLRLIQTYSIFLVTELLICSPSFRHARDKKDGIFLLIMLLKEKKNAS